MKKPKIIAIVGPTASGKTSLSIELAKSFNGEIISADSRQIYRGMDIGTAKITSAEMLGVPHHLIDIIEPNETYTAVDFKNDAINAILAIQDRGHLPIIAGGTFFYLDVLRGRRQSAPVEPNLEFRKTISNLTNSELFALLKARDSRRAATIDRSNRRRLERALEVVDAMGRVPESVTIDSPYDWLIIGLKVDKGIIIKNYEKRFDDWLKAGFIKEVTSLLQSGVSRERFREIGYEYTLALDFIDNRITKQEFKQKFIEKNWQFAKRQLTWLKRDEEIEWFSPQDQETISNRVQAFLSN